MNTYTKRGEGGLGIYIQVPFCQTKCTYCNFHTGVASPAAYAPYARAVEREIRDWRALHAAASLDSATCLPSGDIAKGCHSERSRSPQHTPVLRELGWSSEESAFAFNVAPGCGPAFASQLDPIQQPITRVVEPKKAVDITAFFRPENADTIYLGGGTPSLFDPADLARILEAVRSQFAY